MTLWGWEGRKSMGLGEEKFVGFGAICFTVSLSSLDIIAHLYC